MSSADVKLSAEEGVVRDQEESGRILLNSHLIPFGRKINGCFLLEFEGFIEIGILVTVFRLRIERSSPPCIGATIELRSDHSTHPR